ncbi:hypothetical protein [Sinomonas terrae]|uniref:Uncharacterized protein n=1 Tax=Sinomonas terrae TaxID=2908838 RepID=A0ABS9U6K7_9MICC|nr:hypothetical protein [Sinomonas terrae]MCH6472230.1 hypothetical protein [Sinomonas terrae]
MSTMKAPGADAKVDFNVIGYTQCVAELVVTHLETPENRKITRTMLVRGILEFGVTASWLRGKGDAGLAALRSELYRTNTNAALEHVKIGEEGSRLVTLAQEHLDSPSPEWNELVPQAKFFEQKCKDMDTDLPLYVLYRDYSQFCHPSLGTPGVHLPEKGDPEGWHFDRPPVQVFLPFVWAVSASNQYLKDAGITTTLNVIGSMIQDPIGLTVKTAGTL